MKLLCYLHQTIHERLYCRACDMEVCELSQDDHNAMCKRSSFTKSFKVPIGMVMALAFFRSTGRLPIWQSELEANKKDRDA